MMKDLGFDEFVLMVIEESPAGITEDGVLALLRPMVRRKEVTQALEGLVQAGRIEHCDGVYGPVRVAV